MASNVFWLGELSLHSNAFEAGLRELGLKAEWIQEAHLLGKSLKIPGITCFHWPLDKSAAHRLLHFTCQTLESGDLDLLLMVSGDKAAVLGSPRAIGRWNLLPRAALSARFSYSPAAPPGEFLPALALQLAAAEIDSQSAGLAAAIEGEPFALTPAFPEVTWLPPTQADLVKQLNTLCAALELHSANLGLLFSPGLATLIERV